VNGGRRAAALAVVLLAAWLAARAAPPSHESAGARPLAALRVATLAERILKL